MPAIQPARLKQQAVDLAEKFNQPATFVRELHRLLDQYSDHTHRSGQSGEPFPLISAYNSPPPVMRQVWVELNHQIKNHPEFILPLCDTLWAESNHDLQLLAVRLLGQVPIEPPAPVLERLRTWVRTGLDKRLLDGLLIYGLEQFRLRDPAQVLILVTDWLTSGDLKLQQTGLRALLILSDYPGLENLPSILKLITPYVRIAPTRLRPDIVALLSVLARLSPSETAYLLHQNLTTPDNPDTPWLIRQVLGEFPEDLRLGLRTAMKEITK
jgi:DNA alkylation repair enzyme